MLYFISASLSGYAATELMVPMGNDDVKPPGKKNLLKITNYEPGASYMFSSNSHTRHQPDTVLSQCFRREIFIKISEIFIKETA